MTDPTDAEKLTQAIQALESQRQVLGDALVESALAPLRQKLASLQSNALGGQRKLVTILFSDLVGFTAMSAALDAEDVREIINAYFARWSACITRHAGLVEKYIGDAVLAVFGLPGGHEDDPERAVRAALDMQKELDQLNVTLQHDRGLQLAMRVGISTGEVVVSLLGERLGEEFVVVGDVVNLTSRLQSAAPENGILITHDTYRHIRGMFDLSDFGPLQMKGIAQPVQVYRVMAARPRSFRLAARGIEGIESPLVGRTPDLLLLENEFRRVLNEHAVRAVTLVGDAGLGKSRLLYEFENWVDLLPERVFYFRGRAHPSSQNVPYSLIRDVFAFRCQMHDSDPPAVVREKLEHTLTALLPGDSDGVMKAHFIGRLLGFEIGESEHLRGIEQDAKALHDRALKYLADTFNAVGQAGPALVLLEDLHWADRSSLDIFPNLGTQLAQQPFLFVCTARPLLFERIPDWGEHLPFHTRHDLTPLSMTDSASLVNAILKKVDPLPEALRSLVVATSEGNPFYIEELVKMLIDDGVIDVGAERWTVDKQRLGGLHVPPTLVGVLQARLDALAPEQRAAMQRAAVIGRVFWDQAVASLAVDEPTQPVSAPVFDHLRRRDMIFRHEHSAFEDTVEYQFKHALLRDVSYTSLLKRQRRAYHDLAARWLEEVTGRTQRSAEFTTLIAEHHEQAGNLDLAAGWFQRAGKAAAALFANTEAVRAYTRALELLPGAGPDWRFSILSEREKVYDLMGRREDQLADIEAMRQAAVEVGDAALISLAALRMASFAFHKGDFPAALAQAHEAEIVANSNHNLENAARSALLQASIVNRQGEMDKSRNHALRAVQLAQQQGLLAVEAEAFRIQGLVEYFQGKPAGARDYFLKALQLYRQAGDRRGEGSALNNLGSSLLNMGDYDDAGRYYAESLQLCREIGDRLGEARAMHNSGIVSVTQGKYDLAEDYYLQSLAICRALGNRSFELSALDNLGNLAIYRYHYTLALEYQLAAYQGALEIGDILSQGMTITNLVRAYLNFGMLQKAWESLQESFTIYEQVDDRQGSIQAGVNFGIYLLLTGDVQQALAVTKQSLDRAAENDLRSELAAAAQANGYILYHMQRYPEALDRFQQALEIAEELEEDKEAIVTLAMLALAHLGHGDPLRALQAVERILQYISLHGQVGFEKPILVFLSCYETLAAVQDPRAEQILQQGYDLLQHIIAKIADEAQQRGFLDNLPENRRFLQHWQAQGHS